MFTKILAGGIGLAAVAAAAPAAAQYPYGYYPPATNYGYSPYNYNPYAYSNNYGYYNNRANMTQVAASQCTAAVQARLNNRTSLAEVVGSLVGINSQGRVLTVSSVTPSSTRIRVRGLASSGRMAYNPYGYGYYGAVGSSYATGADISYRCDVDYRGRVRDIDLDRRR